MMAVNRKGPKALHRQMYDAYRAAIIDGSLRPGQRPGASRFCTRIPSPRVLASEIGVSRFPVLTAYAQLLAEDYFESRVGAGTVIASSLPDQLTSSKPAGSTHVPTPSGTRPVGRRSSVLPRVVRFPWLQNWGAFRVGQVAFDQFPLDVCSNLVARRCRSSDAHAFHYGDQTGFMAFRETIANYLLSEDRPIVALRS
jgi:GntR family transcriptional regulator/MocR family aminotransferase